MLIYLCDSFGMSDTSQQTSAGGTVYICTGPMSKRYHCDRYCRGLNSCSKEVIAVSLEKAKKMEEYAAMIVECIEESKHDDDYEERSYRHDYEDDERPSRYGYRRMR